MARPLVSDELWELIEPLIPKVPRRHRFPGRKRIDDRKVLTGILFVLRTGIPWEYLQQEMGCGSGVTCWRRLRECGVAAEDPLGDDHGRHGFRPGGVKGEMGDRFDELLLAVPVLLGVVEVEYELVGVAARGERSDGDEAALLGRKVGALPDLAEEDVVSEPDESGGEVTEQDR